MAAGEEFAMQNELRESFEALGRLLGIAIVVTDQDECEIISNELRVGLGWYAHRGHSKNEAIALAALQLWEGPFTSQRSAELAHRRLALATLQPRIDPLIRAVARVQAIAELTTALPGLRGSLGAAMARSLPDDAEVLPLHLQWAVQVLAQAVPLPGLVPPPVARTVREKWHLIEHLAGEDTAGYTIDPLRRVFAVNPSVSHLTRFERAVALLLPVYEQLLRLDINERGLAGAGGNGQAPAADDEQLDIMLTPEPSAETVNQDLAHDPAEATSGEPANDGSQGGHKNHDEHAESDISTSAPSDTSADDLFASQRSSFVSRVLETPMPEGSALFEAASNAMQGDPGAPSGELRGASSPRGLAPNDEVTALAHYRLRVQELAAAIERMRGLWTEILAERTAIARARSRTAQPEGDELATEALASAVAESLAGVKRPRAFRTRITRARSGESVGSTDYVLMVDRSASMTGRVAEAAADAMLIMVEALAAVERDVAHAEQVSGIELDLDIRTCLIVFGAEASVVKPLSAGMSDESRRRVHAAIREPRGSTNDGSALRAAAEQLGIGPQSIHGDAGGVRRKRVAILVSDGGSNDEAAAARELRGLRAADVHVYGVGIGSDDILARYAPDGVRIDDPRALAEALEQILHREIF